MVGYPRQIIDGLAEGMQSTDVIGFVCQWSMLGTVKDQEFCRELFGTPIEPLVHGTVSFGAPSQGRGEWFHSCLALHACLVAVKVRDSDDNCIRQ